MEKKDSEPQKSDLPGSVDSGKLNSAGQTLRWSDVKITDPDDDQEQLVIKEDDVKNNQKSLDLSQQYRGSGWNRSFHVLSPNGAGQKDSN